MTMAAMLGAGCAATNSPEQKIAATQNASPSKAIVHINGLSCPF